MTPEEWGAVGTLAVAIVTAGATVAVGRRSREGDERTYQLQSDAGIASGYNLLTGDLRRDIEELRRDRDQDRKRITDLEGRLDRIGRRYREAVSYIRVLRAFITDNVQGHEPPPMPSDLTLDID